MGSIWSVLSSITHSLQNCYVVSQKTMQSITALCDPPLCKPCQNLRREVFDRGKYHRHLTVAQLRRSVKVCALCKLIVRAICRTQAEPGQLPPDFETALARTLEKGEILTPDRSVLLKHSKGFRYAYVCLEREKPQDEWSEEHHPTIGMLYFYDPFSEPDPFADRSPLVQIPCHGHLPARLDDEVVFTRITKWTNACEREHDHSASLIHQVFVPSRLLYIQMHENRIQGVELVNTKEVNLEHYQAEKPRYMTLSHRWGGDHKFVTKKDNFSSHCAGIPFQKLPQTFQDAVVVCARLHISFIWIDSLCIVQDDMDDWKREAIQMGDVYANSFCTIAASSARTSSDGFLKARQLFTPVKVGGSRPFFATDGADMREDVDRGLLNTRAWVFQERMLCQRTIHFTANQVYWECRDKNEYDQEIGWSSGVRMWAKSFDTTPFSAYGQFPNDWLDFITTYSQRELTYETDRLIAISGLVSRLKLKLRRDDYVFYYGIWNQTFQKDLCWMSLVSPTPRKAAERYHAPAWSWASHNGPVVFVRGSGVQVAMEVVRFPSPGIFIESSTSRVALTVRAQLTLLPNIGNNIDAFPSWLDRSFSAVPNWYKQSTHLEELLGQDGRVIGWMSFDKGRASNRDTNLYCAFLLYQPRNFTGFSKVERKYFVLVLKETEKPSEFTRVGFGCIEIDGWYENTPEQEFTIW